MADEITDEQLRQASIDADIADLRPSPGRLAYWELVATAVAQRGQASVARGLGVSRQAVDQVVEKARRWAS